MRRLRRTDLRPAVRLALAAPPGTRLLDRARQAAIRHRVCGVAPRARRFGVAASTGCLTSDETVPPCGPALAWHKGLARRSALNRHPRFPQARLVAGPEG